jgi:voltage-dependent calcium channel
MKTYMFKQFTNKKGENLAGRGEDEAHSGEAVFDLLLERRVVEEFLDKNEPVRPEIEQEDDVKELKFKFATRLVRVFKERRRKKAGKENPFDDKYAVHEQIRRDIRRDLLDRRDSLDVNAADFAQEFVKMRSELEEKQRKFLRDHPKCDYSLNIFRPDYKIRQFCQRVVGPSYGIRSNGVLPSKRVWYSFWLFMLVCSVALVIATCINSPLYFKQLTQDLPSGQWPWTVYADLVFVVTFSTEAAIKIIADGFATTPNAYMRSIWNKIDWMVLTMLWVTFFNEAFSNGYFSRYVRAVEAFRALRLMTISVQAQATFHDVVISGIGKILSAATVSLFILFPFSVWGLNLYAGKLSFCTDSSIGPFTDCVDEYLASPFNWNIYAPRAITQSYYDYDTFWHSFLITFEVISLEGWVDVLGSVTAITGSDSNPVPLASRYNGIFPIIYNIIAVTFILTLFVAVIIRNYAQTRGTAYLTDEQLSWYEMQKMLRTVKPAIRYPAAQAGSLRDVFQRQLEDRRSWLNLADRAILLIIVLIEVIQYYPSPVAMVIAQNSALFAFVFLYLVLYLIKLYALGFKKFFNKKWEVFGLLISVAAAISTAVLMGLYMSETYTNFQKVAIIGMLLLWIPKSRRLDKLFKTASTSFRVIGDLIFAWFILFLVFAIAFNQAFGLTRIGPNGDQNLNFRTVPKALILLFRMSTGEGWNQILNDYLVSPPYCVSGDVFVDTDCGSHPFAYILFISWNILSMYIFVNMFVSLIYENFSYVFHHSSARITSHDLQLFKKAWQEFDPLGTGYIDTSNLYKFLHRCEGYFSMSIYYGNYTVPNILSKAMIDPNDSYNVDCNALAAVMRNYPGDQFKKRRQLYDLFCEQALHEAHPTKGISFYTLLHQIPLYKDIDYSKCLK